MGVSVERSRSSRPPPALVAAFERFVSPINARALARSLAQRALSGSSTTDSLLRHLEASAAYLVAADRREALLAAAREVLESERVSVTPTPTLPTFSKAEPARPEPASSIDVMGPSVAIRKEADLNEARLVARQMCQQVGLQGFAAQKLVTAVSELARNVAKYAAPGRVVFSNDAAGRRLRVVVSDRGTGIALLTDVMGGKYRSKTGMGLGLIGTKKLVDEFEITTGPTGTTVTIAVRY
jgi:serine/threonine-protein kinase RsbT